MTVKDKLSHRHGISVLAYDSNIMGKGGGLRETHRVKTIKKNETFASK